MPVVASMCNTCRAAALGTRDCSMHIYMDKYNNSAMIKYAVIVSHFDYSSNRTSTTGSASGSGGSSCCCCWDAYHNSVLARLR